MSLKTSAKIVLPTVETCGWRSEPSNGDARCGLIGSLVAGQADLDRVSLDQCSACCRSYPPTPDKLNPVIASLLFARLQAWKQTVSARETEAISRLNERRVEQLLALAQRCLPASQDRDLMPIRAQAACHYLGPPNLGPPNLQPAHLGDGLSAEDGLSTESEKSDLREFRCFHPSHSRTNMRQCSLCHDWSIEPQLFKAVTLREMMPPVVRRGSVKSWAVGVTTAPRIESTLGPCLDALMRAGWLDPHLFLDGSVRVPLHLSHLTTTWREQSVGASTAWMLAWSELVALNPNADAYALFQDDAYVHHGESLRVYLESILWPGQRPGVVSLYNPSVSPSRGWQLMPRDWDWGTLAVIFPGELLREFLSDSKVWQRALPTVPGEHRPIPELLREWLHRRGIDAWVCYPSLVQHIGRTSSIWPFAGLSGQRRAAWFSADVNHAFNQDDQFDGFDEAAFPPRPAVAEEYHQRIALGQQRMAESSVVICALASNVRLSLPRNAARISRMARAFGDYRVVIVEHASSDGTRDCLDDWQKVDSNVEIIGPLPSSNGNASVTWSPAMLRNRYLQHVVHSYAHFTHLVVLDLDLMGGWSLDGLAHTFGCSGWDCVGSNGIEQRMLPPQKRPRRQYSERPIWSASTNMAEAGMAAPARPPRRGNQLLPTESCFGGLAVYTMRCGLSADYGTGYSGDEHFEFHRQLRAKGLVNQFMNPSQIAVKSVLIA